MLVRGFSTYKQKSWIKSFFYKKNILQFTSDNCTVDIGSNVYYVAFENAEKIDLNSSILNEHVFKNIGTLGLWGEFKAIQIGLLKSFKSIKNVVLDHLFSRQLFHRVGIQWIFDLNADVNLDGKNKSLYYSGMIWRSPWSVTNIWHYINNEEGLQHYFDQRLQLTVPFFLDINMRIFPDEDFCLYVDFPFNQWISMEIMSPQKNSLSCTYLWLRQYSIELLISEEDLIVSRKNCQLEKRFFLIL